MRKYVLFDDAVSESKNKIRINIFMKNLKVQEL